METYRLIEQLKESIQRDFRVLEVRCNEAQKKLLGLEQENETTKKKNSELKRENARKVDEFRTKEKWWDRYRLMTMKDHGTFPTHILEKFVKRAIDEQMDDVPNFPSPSKENEPLKKYKNLSTLKGRKKIRYDEISNSKEKKEGKSVADNVRVCSKSSTTVTSVAGDDDVLFSDPNESTKLYEDTSRKRDNQKASTTHESTVTLSVIELETEDLPNCHDQQEMKRSVFDGAPSLSKRDSRVGQCPPQVESTNGSVSSRVSTRPKGGSYDVPTSSQRQEVTVCSAQKTTTHQNVLAPDSEDVPCSPNQLNGKESGSRRLSPEMLVPDTEDPFPEEAELGSHSAIGAPSASSTPLTAVDSSRFHFRNDDDDETNVGIGGGAVASPCDDTVSLLTVTKAHAQLSTLPKSDSQFPVDLSYSQPQSPTVPSRTRSLQEELDLSADCSVSLLPHGDKKKNDFDAIFKTGTEVKDNEDEDFVDNVIDELKKQLKRGDEEKNLARKTSRQTTLDTKLLKAKGNKGEKDATNTCTTPVSCGEDMDQSADLFGNMDDPRSPEANKEPGKQNEASLEKTDKENVLHKNPDNKPSYKYVEVVRKRDERAKLNGYDCRECQQYYQGLDLPEEELKKRLKHCSRHRARFSPPPSTPPGFWNLSFPDTQEYIDKGYLQIESQAPAPKRLRRARKNKRAK
ncbi:DNA endonuclease RBBP8 [Acropora cervicornis]|uniref:DNA endonuclease RBBP8 n=1 Tax=Acropora cervicornis TaxID=6130 RepID=A0AAD9QEJ0_ACRCE|nr:DNA endonuclease RBBP8 [Acropora cervicornis]